MGLVKRQHVNDGYHIRRPRCVGPCGRWGSVQGAAAGRAKDHAIHDRLNMPRIDVKHRRFLGGSTGAIVPLPPRSVLSRASW